MLFRLTTFGQLALHDCASQHSRLVQRKALALLAVLAVAGKKGMSRERLVALLWPDSSEESGRGALKQTIYELRRAVGKADVVVGTIDLALDSAVIATDLAEFLSAYAAEDWKRVVEIHHAPFLDALSVRHSGEFERWAESQRARYREMFRRALEQLAADATELGDAQGAVMCWRTLAAEDPLSTRSALGLMNALAAAGDRVGALGHYRLHEALLRDESGTGPDPALAAAAEHIRENGSPQRIGATTALPMRSDVPAVAVPIRQGVSPARPAAAAADPIHRTRAPRAAIILVGASALVIAVMAITSEVAFDIERLPIAVVPFENMSSDRSLDAIGMMAADWVTEGVVRAHLAPVIEPSYTAAAVRGGSAEAQSAPRNLAERAGAGVVITGRVYMAADSLRFHAVVTNVRSGRVLAAFGPLTHSRAEAQLAVTDVADRVVGALARVYDRRLGEVMDSLQPPPRAEAYRHYIRGLGLYARQGQADSAVREFRAAYALDTSFVTALVWSVWPLRSANRHAEARSLIDSLDLRRSSLSPVHRNGVDALKALYTPDLDGAIAAAARAAAMAPQSEWAWNEALLTLWANRPVSALRLFRQLHPSRGWLQEWGSRYWVTLASAHHVIGDFDGALAAVRDAPSDGMVDLPVWAGINLAQRGQYSGVERYATELVQSDTADVADIIRDIILEMVTHNSIGGTGRGKAALDSVVSLYRGWLARRPAPVSDQLRFTHASIMYHAEQLPEARRELSSLVAAHSNDLLYAGSLARILARQGDSTGARALLASFQEPPPYLFMRQAESALLWRAQVEAWLGHRAEATALLSAAFRSGIRRIHGGHTWATAFPTLRGYKPFEELVRSR